MNLDDNQKQQMLKWLAKLTPGASLKKKAVVVLARRRAIDLWRWRTGRCTAAELGWYV